MPKKPRVRILMDSPHVKVSETLLKSAREYLCHVFDNSERKSARKDLF